MEFSFPSFKHCLSSPVSLTTQLLTKYSAILLAATLPVLATPASAATCEYVIGNEWSTGYSAEIVITNTTSSTINQWEVNWAYATGDQMSNGWNATITGSNPYQATPLSWNGVIAPGGSVAFGFNVQKATAGSNAAPVSVSGDVCSGAASSSSAVSSLSSSSVPSSSVASSAPSSSAPSSSSTPTSTSLASSVSSSVAPSSSVASSSSSLVASSVSSVASSSTSSSSSETSSALSSSSIPSSSSAQSTSSLVSSSSSVISSESSSSAVSSIAAMAVSCVIGSENVWNSGFVLNEITVTNNGSTAINQWAIEIPFDRSIGIANAWNAEVTASGNSALVIGSGLNPGQSASFGFQGSYAGANLVIGDCLVTEPSGIGSSSSNSSLASSEASSRVVSSSSSAIPTSSSSALSSSSSVFSSSLSSSLALSSSSISSSESISSSSSSLSSLSSSSQSSAAIGLDTRPVSETCIAGDAPTAGDLALTEVWPAVNFQQPIGLVQMPGDVSNDYYVMQKGGLIYRLPADFSASSPSVFLDLRGVVETGGEGGVLSMAFHPDYPTAPYVYVAHMVDENGFKTRISRFTSLDGITASDEQVLFNLPQDLSPFGSGSIHNAGTLVFGPDGFLYMSLGDDKRTFDVGTPDQLYGTVIRIDVDGGPVNGYSIPPGNMFGNEVYAYGFRNPWRISFDRLTGELWLADVGEECYEEINRVDNGLDYGWPNWEADECGPAGCDGDNTLPVFKYHQGDSCGLGNSVTGGYVYRGDELPQLQGQYVYGDFQTGVVWAFDPATGSNQTLFGESRAMGLAAWGEDNSGELYYIDLVNNNIAKLASAGGPVVEGPPQDLADTGCFSAIGAMLEPAEGVVPYTIAQPFWSDGAEKSRFLSLPVGSQFTADANGDWELPIGGVLIKHFTWQGANFETRFFVRYSDGTYGAYTYEWTSSNTATLVPAGGGNRTLPGGHEWQYPSRNQCFQCHTQRAGFILGPETRQMNIANFYPSTGRTGNQVATLQAVGMLGDLPELSAPLPTIDDNGAPLAERAESYLHVNCASCHRGSGGGQSQWDARITTPFANKGLCNVPPITEVTGSADERYIKPGDHLSSAIWWRMHTRGEGQMPPIASTIADLDGAALLESWINAMAPDSCPEPEATVCNLPSNLISNCDFSNGATDWELREGPGGEGSASVVAGEYQITIANAGSATWHVQGLQVVGSISPASYHLRFDARAASPRIIEVNVGEQGDDWSSLCQESISLDTTMRAYSIECGPIGDTDGDNNVKVDFNVGDTSNASVIIDNVYFGE